MNMNSVPCQARISRQKSANPLNVHQSFANWIPQTPVIWKLCICELPVTSFVSGISLYIADTDQVLLKSFEWPEYVRPASHELLKEPAVLLSPPSYSRCSDNHDNLLFFQKQNSRAISQYAPCALG